MNKYPSQPTRRARIEHICTDALDEVGLLPEKPSPIRIERFIEKRFGFAHDYDNDMPDGVLGYSIFGKKGVNGIYVARSLDEEGTVSSERRIRTTLAHEAGHGLFHGHLFASGETPIDLFNKTNTEAPKILCREMGESYAKRGGYDGGWWEVQANQAIGALLMPMVLVRKAVEPFLTAKGLLGLKALDPKDRETAAQELAKIFNVNPAASRVRLEVLYPPVLATQLTL